MNNNEIKNDIAFVKELAEIVQDNQFTEVEVEKHISKEKLIKIKITKEQTSVKANNRIPEASISPTPVKKIVDESLESISDPANHPGTVSSPMVGTIYIAPEPGGKPFVEIGTHVKKGDTLVIIEAMKTLNQIPSTKEGKISRILVEDGTPVEFGSPLVIIE